MKTCLQTFMCECVEVLNKAICNEDMLANPLCVSVEDLNKAICNEDMLANRKCVHIVERLFQIMHILKSP